MSWWIDFFSNFSGPLDFIDWIVEQVKQELGDLAGSIVDTVKGVLSSIYNSIMSGVHAYVIDPFENFINSTLSFAGPFAPVLAVFLAGLGVFALIWVLKRLYELL